ncbi:hypothetical protein [Thalassotalea sp. SU-HH00458]|uniref:hypothetical protein n=1 Tax=Thalassotalea sp. SU-HH00458 TaxID=3127657 RepID=UPI0031045C6A
MSVGKFLENIKNKIENSVEARDKSHYTHLRTALSNLMKYELTSDYTLKDDLTVNVEDTLKKYKDIITKEGKADTRGPLSKVRRLSEYYIEITDIDYDNLSVSELLLKASKLKFECDIYVGTIPKKNRFKIKEEITTLSEICSLIVREAYELAPDSWNIDDIDNRIQRNNSVSIIKKWFTGERYPTAKIPTSRLNSIEKALNLPVDILVKKSRQLSEQNNINKYGGSNENNKKTHRKKNSYVIRILNPEFYQFYQQYSNYKIYGEKPEVKYPLETGNKYTFGESTVRELDSKGKEGRWTAGNNGRNSSLQRLNSQLRAFCHYCVSEEKIAEEDVSLSHLTDSKLLERMKLWVQRTGGIGYVLFDSLLLLIKATTATRGFLRLSGNKGDRCTEEYFAELDYLQEEIPVWSNHIRELKANVSKETVGRKLNVRNILKMELGERRQLFDDMNKNLIERSESNYQEALFFLKKSRSNSVQDSYRERLLMKSFKFLNKAYGQSMTAMILQSSFQVCPRVGNWATLNFFKSKEENIHSVPSFSKALKNRYEIDIPLSGPNLLNYNERIRYIKNAKASKTKPIRVILKEYFSPTINQFLKIRELYINEFMEHYANHYLDKLITQEKVLVEGKGKCIFESSVLQYFIATLNEKLESKTPDDISFFKKAIALASVKLPETAIKDLTKKQLDRAVKKADPRLIEKAVLELQPDIIEKVKKEAKPETINIAIKEIKEEIKAYSNFDNKDVIALFPWVSAPRNYTRMSFSQIISNSQQESSISAALERRVFIKSKISIAPTYKDETKNTLNILVPDSHSNGINIHANRHLCAMNHLDEHPGETSTVAAMINDTEMMVILTYASEDREKMMDKLSHMD